MYYSYTILSGSRNSVDLDLLAIYLDDSAVGLVNSAEDLDQCGLSCTILTEQCVYLSQLKGKVDAAYSLYSISRTVCPILNLQVSKIDLLLSCFFGITAGDLRSPVYPVLYASTLCHICQVRVQLLTIIFGAGPALLPVVNCLLCLILEYKV